MRAEATIGGLARTHVYDRASLALKSVQTGPGAVVQNLGYDWYPSGNLKQRIDSLSGRTEDFTYDALNRLDTQNLNGAQILNLDYGSGGDGNVSFKTGVGTYSYGGSSARPHAVISITGLQNNTYAYDANGNMTNRDGDLITWYSYNLPKRINYGSDYSEFWYGTERSRYKQVSVDTGVTVTTRYVGDHFEVEQRGALTIYRHHILAGASPIAQYERRSDGSNPVRYLHRDHLGSVVATTDSGGLSKQRFEFEPHGARWRTLGSGADDTERGFTGHEHLDSADLIHMNGRVQDPVLGRMISADPMVLHPYSSQALNRYSYVWNNPTTLIDPSGFDPIWDPQCECFVHDVQMPPEDRPNTDLDWQWPSTAPDYGATPDILYPRGGAAGGSVAAELEYAYRVVELNAPPNSSVALWPLVAEGLVHSTPDGEVIADMGRELVVRQLETRRAMGDVAYANLREGIPAARDAAMIVGGGGYSLSRAGIGAYAVLRTRTGRFAVGEVAGILLDAYAVVNGVPRLDSPGLPPPNPPAFELGRGARGRAGLILRTLDALE